MRRLLWDLLSKVNVWIGNSSFLQLHLEHSYWTRIKLDIILLKIIHCFSDRISWTEALCLHLGQGWEACSIDVFFPGLLTKLQKSKILTTIIETRRCIYYLPNVKEPPIFFFIYLFRIVKEREREQNINKWLLFISLLKCVCGF